MSFPVCRRSHLVNRFHNWFYEGNEQKVFENFHSKILSKRLRILIISQMVRASAFKLTNNPKYKAVTVH